jgi:hypothetical protein
MIQMGLQHVIFKASKDGKIKVFTERSFSVRHRCILGIADIFFDQMEPLCLPQSVKLFFLLSKFCLHSYLKLLLPIPVDAGSFPIKFTFM